jgi:hypothetical protein
MGRRKICLKLKSGDLPVIAMLFITHEDEEVL